MSDNLTKKFP